MVNFSYTPTTSEHISKKNSWRNNTETQPNISQLVLTGSVVAFFQIGSFFMINLCLVVIATQFSETKRRETAKMKAERARFQSSSTLSSFTNSETTNCYREIIRLIAHLIRKGVSRSKKTYRQALLNLAYIEDDKIKEREREK